LGPLWGDFYNTPLRHFSVVFRRVRGQNEEVPKKIIPQKLSKKPLKEVASKERSLTLKGKKLGPYLPQPMNHTQIWGKFLKKEAN